MKKMKLSLYLNDYETEKLFSYLRWLFLLVSVMIFYVPPFSINIPSQTELFPYLLTAGCIYMLVTQIALYRMRDNKKNLHYVLKAGILFDYIALIWLMALSGGVHSPLYPISILFVLHATIYWRTKGAFISLLSFNAAYIAMGYMTVDLSLFEHYFTVMMNVFFLCIIGVFGALIMLRERSHFVQKETYHFLMHQDYLSGLFNHRSFQEKLRENAASGKSFSLLLGDIDDFKKVNDEYGHQKGDEVIKEVGDILRAFSSDHKGQAFRYGGEEFALLLPRFEEEHLTSFLDKLYEELRNARSLPISMSFGQACSFEENEPGKLLSLADKRLYKAKQSGKKRVCLEGGGMYSGDLDHVIKEAK
ncbi:GGDEF domain-containing protein [[Bacillus] enclensis]|uniref:GGDEF domain-containing protein n=1 Tax=[Bacillus] enclensis TaxID=1402860 RepID=UPI0018DD74D2|nr:GGDEF domain-containing protein [[Bacillus] enclensis]MBH9968952.1 GGDEF domain-containing protein [[Bacillus] enclensis]